MVDGGSIKLMEFRHSAAQSLVCY